MAGLLPCSRSLPSTSTRGLKFAFEHGQEILALSESNVRSFVTTDTDAVLTVDLVIDTATEDPSCGGYSDPNDDW